MQYNSKFKKIFKNPDNVVIDAIVYSVHKLAPLKDNFYRRNVKYSNYDYAAGIVEVLKKFESWNAYNGSIKPDTLRKKFNEWVKLGIFDNLYSTLLNKFLNKNRKTDILKYQSIDSMFIEDINGSKKSSYSGIYKRRKGESSLGIKVTSVVTTNGLPISINVSPANNNDSPLLPDAINNIIIDCNTKKYANHNRYKQYLLADSGYDSKSNINFLKKKGYVPLIKQNKRSIKNKKLIRNFNVKQQQIYKKRIIIENYHSWIKKFTKIKRPYERNINNYKGLLLLAASIIIQRRMTG